jgi:hypothetical protein
MTKRRMNMKIQELKELLSSNEDLSVILPIKKKYISFQDKRDIVLNIPFYAIRENIEGFQERDRLFENMITTVLLSSLVLELNIDGLYEYSEESEVDELQLEVAIELYDLLEQYKVLGYMMQGCDCVYEIMHFCEEVIEDRIKVGNSFTGMAKKMLDGFLTKMPDTDSMQDVLTKLPEVLNGLKPDKLKLIAGALGMDMKTPRKKTTTKKK